MSDQAVVAEEVQEEAPAQAGRPKVDNDRIVTVIIKVQGQEDTVLEGKPRGVATRNARRLIRNMGLSVKNETLTVEETEDTITYTSTKAAQVKEEAPAEAPAPEAAEEADTEDDDDDEGTDGEAAPEDW